MKGLLFLSAAVAAVVLLSRPAQAAPLTSAQPMPRPRPRRPSLPAAGGKMCKPNPPGVMSLRCETCPGSQMWFSDGAGGWVCR